MNFVATKHVVSNRGTPPDSFLEQLVAWGKSADESIFAANDNPKDIYAIIRPKLGPWTSIDHRRAAMLEAMRVHAGFESSWNWNEGVDTTNAHSQAHIDGQEAGIFQVSPDSMRLGNSAMMPFAVTQGITAPLSFIVNMKANHPLALEYYARLVRVSIVWAGPLARGEVLPWLRRDAVAEFQALLA